MEAKNFRIGNLVRIKPTALHADGCSNIENKYFEIGELKNDVVHFKGFHAGEYYKDIEGIPLNNGLLSLYGFRRSAVDAVSFLPVPQIKSEIHFENHNYGQVVSLQCSTGCFIPNDIKYFHQLQNLFFAITGQELELKHERSACG